MAHLTVFVEIDGGHRSRLLQLLLCIDAIKDSYLGGWPAFMADNGKYLGCGAWRDDHLFCIGGMDGSFLSLLVRETTKKGMVMIERENGRPSALRDGCILDGRRLTLPCDWVEFADRRAIYLRGTEPGEVISMRSYRRQHGIGDPDSRLAESRA